MPTSGRSIGTAAALAALLTAMCAGIGYAAASVAIEAIASLMGVDELTVTGPDDVFWVRLKLALVMAVPHAFAGIATVVEQLRGARGGWPRRFAVRAGLVAMAVAGGLVAELLKNRWAVRTIQEINVEWGGVAPSLRLVDVVPGAWGVASGVVAGLVIGVLAGIRAGDR